MMIVVPAFAIGQKLFGQVWSKFGVAAIFKKLWTAINNPLYVAPPKPSLSGVGIFIAMFGVEIIIIFYIPPYFDIFLLLILTLLL